MAASLAGNDNVLLLVKAGAALDLQDQVCNRYILKNSSLHFGMGKTQHCMC